MNIVVCVKHALNESELRADSSGRPELRYAPMKMSTFDRNAIEAAVKLKESVGGTTVNLVTIGVPDAKKTIREGLAMGADKGFFIQSKEEENDTLTTSYLLSRAIQSMGGVDLVLCSEGASDTYNAQVGPMIAEWLGLPYFGYVRKIEISNGKIRCEENLDEAVEVMEASLPAVAAVVSEINEPRYPTLLQIMQASKKPMEDVSLEKLRTDGSPHKSVDTLSISIQAVSRKRVMIQGTPEESAQKLVEALAKEGLLK